MHELFRDPFAHHVYQAFLNTLSGHPGQNLQSSARKRKRPLESTSAVSTPSSFVHLQQNFLSVLKGFQWPVLETLVFDKYSAPLIQSVIELDVPVKPKKKSKGKAAESMLVDILLTGGGDPSGIAFSKQYLMCSPRSFHKPIAPRCDWKSDLRDHNPNSTGCDSTATFYRLF